MFPKLSGYLVSLPERLLRSVSALAGGAVHQVSGVVLPRRVRRSRLYTSMVESTLQFLIEQVGQVEMANEKGEPLPDDFLVRRTAGNVVEIAGIAMFQASPVWVLAALSDIAGTGRELISDIAATLQKEGLLEPGESFTSIDQLLDGLEKTTARLAEGVNTPPLDVKTLRREWDSLRAEAAHIPSALLPPMGALRSQWHDLKNEAALQDRSVLEISSVMALAAVRRLPDNARWLSRAARTTGRRTGEILAHTLLDHYRTTLAEIREAGYLAYWLREFQPYLEGAVRQFSPGRTSTTERLLRKRRP